MIPFPRSIDRGPIEAPKGRIGVRHARAFPRSIDRGPIEAGDARLRVEPIGQFPRSIDRGPIEAGATWRRGCTITCFRDQLIAAPLKLLDGIGRDARVHVSAIN